MKNSIKMSAVQAEALTQFKLALQILGMEDGRFGPFEVMLAQSGHDETWRVNIETKYCGHLSIKGVMVLKMRGQMFRLYAAGSDIVFNDDGDHFALSYDIDSKTYCLRFYYKSGCIESLDVNLVTGERQKFSYAE